MYVYLGGNTCIQKLLTFNVIITACPPDASITNNNSDPHNYHQSYLLGDGTELTIPYNDLFTNIISDCEYTLLWTVVDPNDGSELPLPNFGVVDDSGNSDLRVTIGSEFEDLAGTDLVINYQVEISSIGFVSEKKKFTTIEVNAGCWGQDAVYALDFWNPGTIGDV